MKPLTVVIGFVPLALFSLLAPLIGVASAAATGLVAAIVVVAATAQGGLKILSVAQAVILLVVTILGFIGGWLVDAVLLQFGPAIAALALGLFMTVTSSTRPFTAQLARGAVPPELWQSERFSEVNWQLSTVWGLAVLLLGICQVAGALFAIEGVNLVVRLLVNWALPLFAFWRAGVYTKRVASTDPMPRQLR